MNTREQLTAIWNRPGVENPGNINIWSAQGAHLKARPCGVAATTHGA